MQAALMEPLLTSVTLQHLQVPAAQQKKKSSQPWTKVRGAALKNVSLTLPALHSNSSTAGCWSCGPGPIPAHPASRGETNEASCAAAAAESL